MNLVNLDRFTGFESEQFIESEFINEPVDRLLSMVFLYLGQYQSGGVTLVATAETGLYL